MSVDDGPFCPGCGEPVSATADYCMHCYEDFPPDFPEGSDTSAGGQDGGSGQRTGGQDGAADDGSTTGDGTTGPESASTQPGGRSRTTGDSRSSGDQLLDPDGLVDNTLTVVVGIVGGLVVGLIGTIVLLVLTGSGWALLLGIVAWLGATAHLVRRRTVQGAIARTCYAIAVVLLLIPLVAASPVVEDTSLGERAGIFLTTFLVLLVPAGVVAGIGFAASKFVPDAVSEG